MAFRVRVATSPAMVQVYPVLGHVLWAETGEHRDGQQFQMGMAAALHGGAHHRAHGVRGEKFHARARHLRHRAFHRFGYVVDFEIEENVLAFVDQFVDELNPRGGVEFQTHLVKVDVRAELGD